MLSSIVCRAEANAKNYRLAAVEKVAALKSQAEALKQKKLAEKQTNLHMEKAESIRQLKRERHAAEEREMQFKRERDESRSRLEAERARYVKNSQSPNLFISVESRACFLRLFAGPKRTPRTTVLSPKRRLSRVRPRR